MSDEKLICDCISPNTPLTTILKRYKSATSTIIVCRSVAIKTMCQSYFHSLSTKCTPTCLTYHELQYFFEDYPSDCQETIEKHSLASSLISERFKDYPPHVLKSANLIDPLLQYFKRAENEGVSPVSSLNPVYTRYQQTLPIKAKPLEMTDNYFERLSRLIKDTTLICLGFFEWSKNDFTFFSRCIDHTHSVRFIIKYDPLSTHHQFMTRFQQQLSQANAVSLLSPPSQYKHSAKLYSASSSKDEFDFICQSILNKLHSGTDPASIAIILPELHHTRQQLEDRASRYKIPLQLSVGTPFSSYSFAHFILLFLQLLHPKSPMNALDTFLKHPLNTNNRPHSPALIDLIHTLKQNSNLESLITGLQTLCRISHITNPSQEESADGRQEIYDFFTALDELNTIQTLGTNDDPIDLVILLINNLECRPQAHTTKSIQVYSKKEALLCEKDTVFICGFKEGQWPEPTPKTPYLHPSNPQYDILFNAKKHYQFHCYLVDCLLHHCKNVTFTYATKENESLQTPSHLLSLCHQIHPSTPPKLQHITDLDYQIQTCQYAHSHNSPLPKHVQSQGEAQKHLQDKHPTYWGQLCSEHSKTTLNKYLETHPLTASTLDQYQACPYSIYYSKLLKLKPKETLSKGLSHMDWGTLVHRILQRAGNGNGHINKASLERAIDLELSQSELSEFAKTIAALKLHGINDQSGLKDWFIDCLSKIPSSFQLKSSEYVIEGNEQSYSLQLNSSTCQIRGTIDAVFETDSGSVLIVDYKTGSKIPSTTELIDHHYNQLPLYLLAYLQQHPHLTKGSLAYIQLNKASKYGFELKLCDPEDKKELVGDTRKRPKVLDESYKNDLTRHLDTMRQVQYQGLFGPDPIPAIPNKTSQRTQTCSRCDYQSICRYSERFKGGFK